MRLQGLLHREERAENGTHPLVSVSQPCQSFVKSLKNGARHKGAFTESVGRTTHIQLWLWLWGVRGTESKDDTGVMRSYDHAFSLTFNKNALTPEPDNAYVRAVKPAEEKYWLKRQLYG